MTFVVNRLILIFGRLTAVAEKNIHEATGWQTDGVSWRERRKEANTAP